MSGAASADELWRRYRERTVGAAGVVLDTSRVDFPSGFFAERAGSIERAYDAMAKLEAGAIANPDENRRVGHYWLRSPELAPDQEIAGAIEEALAGIRSFAEKVRSGAVRPQRAERFGGYLLVGIGGSALGPQFVSDALRDAPGSEGAGLRAAFFDNTDPDGIERTLAALGERLEETLAVVISKSGGTPETRNGMLEARAAYERAGLDFARHAVAVTSAGSALDELATSGGWLARFPMWDWVGGRTSELSAVGLLPAALEGIDIDGLLAGARAMDEATRTREAASDGAPRNAAMLLALAWHHATEGRGAKDMVVLPYKDRLVLFSRYLQQLVMESLGKELDLDGKVVHQGITVYGNKGSTDQHSYIQQLREGVHNFFATFVEVLRDRRGSAVEVDDGVTSGDYLTGFLLGTREALYEKGRESVTITVEDVTPRSVGALIALFERAVGFYASLVGINAYHQPGVEAGKKAAARVLGLQRALVAALDARGSEGATAGELCSGLDREAEVETAYRVLVHLAANGRGIVAAHESDPASTRFKVTS